MTQVLSADWVLPVAGAPIERGAVAFDGGRIAGFGDGRPFGRWLRTHIERKARIGVEEFLAIARLEAAVLAARGREERPDALAGWEALELATLGAARALHLEDEIGSLGPGKRADLAVVSLAGSPYLPWEDPAAAVVFGGSPDRVLLTLVDGEERYRKGGFGWHELRRSASAARARLLHRKATSPSAEPVAPRT